MAAVVTLLGDTFNTTSGTHTVTATPAVSDLIVIVVANSGNVAQIAPTDNNSDGLGTYSLAATANKSTDADELVIWVRDHPIGSASSTVFTQAPGTSTGGGLAVHKVTGIALVGINAIR